MVKITIMQVLIVMVMNGEDNNDAGGRLTSWSSATLPRTPSWPRCPDHCGHRGHRGHRGLDEEDYHQVGDVDADHGFWGRPEDMNMARSASAPASSLPPLWKWLPRSPPRPPQIIITIVKMVAKITSLTRWTGRHSPSAQATLAQIWRGVSPFKAVFWLFWYQFENDYGNYDTESLFLMA